MFKKLVIASGNKGKLREIQTMLSLLNIEVVPQSNFNVPEAEEPYCTFIENALTKARHASLATNLPALADDSGLCLEALHGKPGVQSAYFAGVPSNDANNNAHLIETLIGHENRAAYYYCCLVLVRRHDDPQPLIAEGIWHGSILKEPRGNNGFGYDPLFLDDMTGKASAELSPEIKNKISHRGQALRKMLHLIEHLTY
ncbi:MAG: RdgB/HAM1 family non-canonical purine NTP pyrophosphatase [Methylophilaceae bacterium]|jgi:XTP/dITP diphosphohydrolase|nr:RdgB/HAM1 family non-canonical purine NTP pyrophosphatase [Methylophilaceae bacterium]MDG1453587.1 RdgB/HAM1 family non-canonical purine NTP pyrophosphatase [Methylophilaceae bacterium]